MQPVYTFDNILKTPAAHNLKIQFSLLSVTHSQWRFVVLVNRLSGREVIIFEDKNLKIIQIFKYIYQFKRNIYK